MTTETKFTAEDFAQAIQYIEKRSVGPELEYTVLAALRIAQRVTTDGVIDDAIGLLGSPAVAAMIRAALTREDQADKPYRKDTP